MADRSVVVLSGTRTAIGDHGGSLKDFPPTQLGALVLREAVKRSTLDPTRVGQVFFGNVIHTEPKDMCAAHVACVVAGLREDVPARTVNWLCGSGFQAIVSGAHAIMLGDTDVVGAGGTESMSRAIYDLPGMRWGQGMGAESIDWTLGRLSDPFSTVLMRVTAENVATKYGITRAEQDACAVESQRRPRSPRAGSKSRSFRSNSRRGKGTTLFDTDEHVRGDSTLESVSKLRVSPRPWVGDAEL